jgi:hypothetical protein
MRKASFAVCGYGLGEDGRGLRQPTARVSCLSKEDNAGTGHPWLIYEISNKM